MSGRLWGLHLPDHALRGAYVSLGDGWPALVAERGYDAEQAALLGQALLAAPLMLAHLKQSARLTLQVSQAGALQLLVAQADGIAQVRGMIKSQGKLDQQQLQGRLVATLEPQGQGERFQGIVALEGTGIEQWLSAYFQQSEQIRTRFLLRADEHQAAGLMLQAIPGEAEAPDWARAVDEMAVDQLPDEPGEWLSIMLGMDVLKAEQASPLQLRCHCSRARVARMLLNLGAQELDDILREQGQVEAECGFCGEKYHYNAEQAWALFEQAPPAKPH